MGWDFLNANTLISGAFGLFSRSAVIMAGGYSTNTVGEDMELILRVQQHYLKKGKRCKISFLPYPVCWTEVPSDIRTLSSQRSRWQQGLIESLWSTKSLFFKPSSKVLGNVALPYLLFFEVLAAPLELFSYLLIIIGVLLGIMNLKLVLLFFCVSMVYGLILSICALLIEEVTFQKYKRPKEFMFLLIACIFEQIGFRQLHLYWRIKGTWKFLIGEKSWGKMVKKGFTR
jgi:cellulose synthase/poly-beta-1,6-N-acetylglucosamine synthase-like glycosyltransferase